MYILDNGDWRCDNGLPTVNPIFSAFSVTVTNGGGSSKDTINISGADINDVGFHSVTFK